MFKTVTHALFDMDGLLLDTEIIYTQVTSSIVSPYGKTFDWSVKSNMIGRPAIDAARYLVSALELPISAEDYLEQRNQLLRHAFPSCQALPGAEALVRHLKSHQIPMALATSSSEDHYRLKTANHRDWFDLFDVVVTGDNPAVTRGKPAPDIFLHAAEQIDGHASSTLVFEDAPSGMNAARAADMQVVVVPDPNMDKARYGDATLILDSLHQFDPASFGLPPLVPNS
jgi:pseudouridine-5'-monophosphatase